MSSLVQKQTALQRSIKRQSVKELVLYNDDVNTFEHVIDTLVKVCHHNPIQAEQSACLFIIKGSVRLRLMS